MFTKQLTKKQIFDLQIKYPELIQFFGDKWWDKSAPYERFRMWNLVSEYQTLSQEFIRDFKDFVNWHIISFSNRNLSEDFIREFKDMLDWSCLSRAQYMSEDFIREFQDKVDWDQILNNQRLSPEFINEISKKIDWDSLSHLSKEVLISNATHFWVKEDIVNFNDSLDDTIT